MGAAASSGYYSFPDSPSRPQPRSLQHRSSCPSCPLALLPSYPHPAQLCRQERARAVPGCPLNLPTDATAPDVLPAPEAKASPSNCSKVLLPTRASYHSPYASDAVVRLARTNLTVKPLHYCVAGPSRQPPHPSLLAHRAILAACTNALVRRTTQYSAPPAAVPRATATFLLPTMS